MATQSLIDIVLKQIKKDIENGDLIALEILLSNVDSKDLLGYLPEEEVIWEK